MLQEGTTMKRPTRSLADLPLHELITYQVELQKRMHGKTQADIAREVGYDKPNMIAMWKAGTAKIPLDKVPQAAKALGMDPAFLFRLAMSQYWPDAAETIAHVFGTVLTENEKALIDKAREITGDDGVPPLTRERARALKDALS
jgi:transcriptional regulator with XRE-family HTH domain